MKLRLLPVAALMPFHNLKIQTKLLLSFVMVFSASILVVIFIYYSNWTNSLRNESINYSSLYIKQLNENLNTYINELDRLSIMLLADDKTKEILSKDTKGMNENHLQEEKKYMEGFLFKLYTFKPDVKNIILMSENGMIYTEGMMRNSLFNQNPNNYSWYRNALSAREKFIIQTNLINENKALFYDDEPLLSITRHIVDIERNRILGCIRIDVPTSKIEKLIKNVISDNPMEIVVSDKRYNIIFDPLDTVKTFDIPGYAEVFDKILETGTGNIQAAIRPGIQTIVYDNSLYTGWVVMGIINDNDLLKGTKFIRNLSIFIAGFTIIIIFMVCFLISYGITNPLKKLRNTMKAVENGDFNAKVKTLYKDEIGDIGRSFNRMVLRISELINREFQMKITTSEAELKALQSQINPHFLHNTLEVVRMKAVINNDREVAEMVKKLSRFYRLNIVGNSDVLKMREELEHVGCYIEIQNIRYSNRFKYIEDVDEELLDAKILKLTLQPIVENAIFHGLESKIGQCILILRGRLEEDRIMLEIIDNGIGIEEERLNEINKALNDSFETDKLGVGIVNVHKRIRFYFGSGYGINITSPYASGGTRIKVTLPFML